MPGRELMGPEPVAVDAVPDAVRRHERGGVAEMALRLQRTAGNAATTRVLARTQADTLKKMQESAGYKALSEEKRKQIDALIGGGTSLATHGWSHMKTLLADPATDLTKADTFTGFLGGKTWLNFDVRLPGEKRLKAAKYTCAAPVEVKAHPYRSGAADATKLSVTVTDTWPDGTDATKTIDIYSPKTFTPYKPGRILPKAEDVAKVVAELPIQSRAQIKRIDLHPVKNPDDTYWENNKEYNPTGKEFNSHMTAGADGTVDIFPSTANASLTEIETSLIHETGHVASNAAWGDDETGKGWDPWTAARKADGISVSTYGDSSNAEDAAESWLLFNSARGTPLEAEVRALIPNRVKLLETLLQHNTPPPAPPVGAPPVTPVTPPATPPVPALTK